MSSSTEAAGDTSETFYQVAGMLSLESSRHDCRELHCWSTAARDRLRHIFQGAYDQWRKDWCGAGAPALGDEDVCIQDSSTSHPISDAEARQLLGTVLFGEHSLAPDFSAVDHPRAPMAQQLIDQAWEAWYSSIEQLLTVEPVNTGDLDEQPFQSAPTPWSGDLLVTFPWGNGRWAALLKARVVRQILKSHGFQDSPSRKRPTGTPNGLSSVTDALSAQALPVRVELNPVSLSLGQLQTLALGDVITLDHRLDEPAVVFLGPPVSAPDPTSPISNPLCAAWLGQRQGQMAIELHPLA